MKIFAVGMNYLQHTEELDGKAYKPEKPVIFTKADSALLKDHKPFFIPDWSSQVDYETELVVRICRLGKTIPERFAHRYYDAVTVESILQPVICSAKHARKDCPGNSARASTARLLLATGSMWRSFATFRHSISISTSMARRCRKAVQAICSIVLTNSLPISHNISH